MEVQRRLIKDLTADPRNARTHSQKNLDAITNSLVKFGQRKPIVISGTGVVLAGNGTLEAAKGLKWDYIDVAVAPHDWDEQTARAFALADNRTAELADWDQSVLTEQLLELHDAELDIEALGFEMPQVIEAEPIDEDELAQLRLNHKVKHGDLWHFRPTQDCLCGDATDGRCVSKT
jgi:ParB-like chromosome segregation protein Spo0J